MRHNVAGRSFGRTANQRKALLRGLVASLIEHQRIETTVAKAKEARRVAEKLVTLGIRGDLHAKRLVLSRLPNKDLVFKLFNEIAPRFKGRNGGYLRIVHTRQRERDRAEMAVLEFVDYEEMREAAEGKTEKKGKKAKAEKKTEKKAEEKAAAKPEKAKKGPAKKKAAEAEKGEKSGKTAAKKTADGGKKTAAKKTAAKKAAGTAKKAAAKKTSAKKSAKKKGE